MPKEMPSPEDLERIQRENLTDEQIGKDRIREDAYEAGKKSGLKDAELDDLQSRVEKTEAEIVYKIKDMIAKENIVKDSRIKIITKGDGILYGGYSDLKLVGDYRKIRDKSYIEISKYDQEGRRWVFPRVPIHIIESIEKVKDRMPV